MSLRFRNTLMPAGRMLPSLGGRSVRPRPLISVGLTGPAATVARSGLLDTGSDDTVFHDALASTIGIDLARCPGITIRRPGGLRILVRFADVTLRLTDGIEYRVWPATVGFTSAILPCPLLGFAGFLQYFTTTFRGDIEEIELAVNALYPGT
jgi:hypothetical protein